VGGRLGGEGLGGREIQVFSAPYWVVRVNEWGRVEGETKPY
jgi:hypothetical protein